MKRLLLIMSLMMVPLLTPMLRADDAAPAYLLGADDVIEITVTHQTDVTRTFTILSDGKISFPGVGDLVAAGKTPQSLAQEIQQELVKTKKNLTVTVGVREVHSRRARIAGAVKAGGGFDLKPGWKLMDMVAMAGGLTSKPVRTKGRLIRRDGSLVELDMVKATTKPESEANPLLKTDDLVILDEVDTLKQVNVLGQVIKPGSQDLTEATSIFSLISEAGGTTEKAALGKAYILRRGEKLPMDLVPALLLDQTDPKVSGFKLQAGDVLMIPEAEAKYAVLGQVQKPGYYAVNEKKPLTVLEALSLAGGQSADAEMRNAGILHKVNGKTIATKINLEDVLRKGDLAKNVTLEQGDILFIPSRSRRQPVSAFDLLSPLSLFANIFR